jgi:exopolysaccharide biosynthesis protein
LEIQKKAKKKKIIIISTTIVLIVSVILSLLVYRYLIEQVEETVVTTENSSSTANTGTVTSDDMNYSSDTTNISIKEVTTGSGDDKITYFVADVKLTEGMFLETALAENKFGRNITETTSAIAESNSAIFAINGDYYGFREDGVVIKNGVLYRDEPARVGLALYNNGTIKSYDENTVSSEELLSNGVTNTLSFGPILVKDGVATSDFESVSVDSNFGNRSIQSSNPRTGIGMIDANHYIFIVVDGRSKGYSKGMTLTEFADTFKELGCMEAYNLDGGGSSTMYFMGDVVNKPSNSGEREISDIIYIN